MKIGLWPEDRFRDLYRDQDEINQQALVIDLIPVVVVLVLTGDSFSTSGTWTIDRVSRQLGMSRLTGEA